MQALANTTRQQQQQPQRKTSLSIFCTDSVEAREEKKKCIRQDVASAVEKVIGVVFIRPLNYKIRRSIKKAFRIQRGSHLIFPVFFSSISIYTTIASRAYQILFILRISASVILKIQKKIEANKKVVYEFAKCFN